MMGDYRAAYWERRWNGSIARHREEPAGAGSSAVARGAKGPLLYEWVLSGPAPVLDLGCGDGWVLRWLPTSTPYFGVDVSRTALHRARAAHPTRGFGELAPMGWARTVLSIDVLYHLVEPAAYRAHLRTMTEPQVEQLIVCAPNLWVPSMLTRGHVRFRRWLPELEACGFRVEEAVRSHGFCSLWRLTRGVLRE